MATSTPWGPAQSSHRIAYGITFYSTAGHGGFKVSKTRLVQMPEPWRLQGGWFEEDCAAALVILAFPAYFTLEQYVRALQSAKHWCPDELRAAGYTVTEEESHVLQERAFTTRHAHDYVVISAWGSWHSFAVPEGQIGVLARVTATGEEAFFLVPKDEYKAGHFVIDLARHPRCAALR